MGPGLIIICVILAAAAVNGQLPQLGALVKRDVVGDQNSTGFIVWFFALMIVGGDFQAVRLPEAGRFMITLVVLAYLLGNKNVLGQLQSAVTTAPVAPVSPVGSAMYPPGSLIGPFQPGQLAVVNSKQGGGADASQPVNPNTQITSSPTSTVFGDIMRKMGVW
jgi:hypothetical protein